MFTGIVEDLGEVTARDGARLVVRSSVAASDVAVGDSIAIDGVCLTVVAIEGDAVSFDVTPETLRRTVLGERGPGERVNVERPATLVSRLGGHLVQGHVDGVGRVMEVRNEADGAAVLSVRIPDDLLPFVVEKGSIAFDGVSLTVAGIDGDVVDVALIPHTLAVTTLGAVAAGHDVNVEVDLIAKYVARNLGSLRDGGIAAEPGKERTA
ncbi:MAG TPA: riboflavin synthase [Actinomycetota bacterium]|nr:riboflavin synthase [Actinomycetota bacterium]